MNLVADESVDADIIRRLRDEGHGIESIADLSPSVSDGEVLARAAQAGHVLLTADKDFGELVYRMGRAHAGVILLRLGGLRSSERADIVAELLRRYAAELPNNFTVVEPEFFRVRRGSGAGPSS